MVLLDAFENAAFKISMVHRIMTFVIDQIPHHKT